MIIEIGIGVGAGAVWASCLYLLGRGDTHPFGLLLPIAIYLAALVFVWSDLQAPVSDPTLYSFLVSGGISYTAALVLLNRRYLDLLGIRKAAE